MIPGGRSAQVRELHHARGRLGVGVGQHPAHAHDAVVVTGRIQPVGVDRAGIVVGDHDLDGAVVTQGSVPAVDVGAVIPEELYMAVAEVLSFIYMANDRYEAG